VIYLSARRRQCLVVSTLETRHLGAASFCDALDGASGSIGADLFGATFTVPPVVLAVFAAKVQPRGLDVLAEG